MIKREAMEAFGGGCIVCGITDLNKLELAHPNGDGNQHRKLLGIKNCGHDFYSTLRTKKWDTDGFKLVVMCIHHHRRIDNNGTNHPQWNPEVTNPASKYSRYYRHHEQYPMTNGDWQQYRNYKRDQMRERRKKSKGIELIAR